MSTCTIIILCAVAVDLVLWGVLYRRQLVENVRLREQIEADR